MSAQNLKAIAKVQHCASMQDVRRHIDALDDILVPLLVTLSGLCLAAWRWHRRRSA